MASSARSRVRHAFQLLCDSVALVVVASSARTRERRIRRLGLGAAVLFLFAGAWFGGLGCSDDTSNQPPSCSNGFLDGQETDLDCGGPQCGPCALGQACVNPDDCVTGVCTESVCAEAASCTNGVLDGQETDLDCGGPQCSPCEVGQRCFRDTDCVTEYCHEEVCEEPFAFRANGGADATTLFDGKEFQPLHDFVTAGEANGSDEALREGYQVEGTAFPDFYRTETWIPADGTGATFSFPVPNGDYVVHLHFVDWASFSQAPGDRVFNVSLEGQEVLEDFDIIAEVGKNKALVKSFPVTVSDGSGASR